MTVYVIMLHNVILLVWQGDFLSFAGFDDANCRVVSCLQRVMWQETRMTSGCQSAGNEGPWSNNLQETKYCQSCELRSRFFLSQASDETTALAATFIVAS